MKRVFTTILPIVMFTCCNTDKQDKGSLARADSVVVSEINHVQTVVAQIKTFTSQVISNGKVLSLQEIPLSFQSEGLIEQITIEMARLSNPKTPSKKIRYEKRDYLINYVNFSIGVGRSLQSDPIFKNS